MLEVTGSEVTAPEQAHPQLSFALAGCFELAPPVKQDLLRRTSEGERLELVCEILERAGAEAERQRRSTTARRGTVVSSHRAHSTNGGPDASSRRRPPDARGRRYHEDVTETAVSTLDARKLRADFPAFEREVHGKPLAYLDSANSSQKPRQVLDAMREFYEHSYANVHRAVYDLAERATAGYEGAREKVRALINAPLRQRGHLHAQRHRGAQPRRLLLGARQPPPGRRRRRRPSSSTTRTSSRGSRSRMRTGAEFRAIPFDGNGELVLESLDEIARAGQVKVVAANWISNTLGTINPIEKLTAWAHEQGAIMVVDAAQAVPHRAGRRSGARLRLPRLHVAQALRAGRRRRPLGPARAAREHVALRDGRRDDPLGHDRGDDLERAAVQVRGRHAGRSPRRTAWASRSTTSRGWGSTRSRSTSTTLAGVRDGAARRAALRDRLRAHRRSDMPASSRSTSRACTRTTSRRCSTGRASRFGPVITARSRS